MPECDRGYHGGVPSEWPLVGRAEELARLVRDLVDEGRGVVLAGPAGVGKTRLASEALEHCRRAGLATARVSATRAGAGIPLGAFASLLPTTRGPQRGAVDDRAHLLHQCAVALAERAAGRRLVLSVDDAHLLDDMSATLVHQLAETGGATLLVTYRCTEPAPDPVMALWKDGLVERVELDGLGIDAVRDVLTTALGGPVDDATTAELMTRSRGNMLFLREMVAGALAAGSLQDVGGLWRVVRELHPSDRLVELVEARLEGLSPPERALLELVAFGEQLGPAELGGQEEIAEALERKGLVSSSVDDRRVSITLAHPLHGEVLRSRVPALRARAIARSLATSVEAAGARRRDDLLRIATWRLVGGGGDAKQMLDAAVVARWRYDFRLAERLARLAIGLGAGFDAALLAAQLAGLQGRSTEADLELEALSGAASDDSQRGLVALTRLDNRVIYAGTIDQGLKIADDAQRALSDADLRDEIDARRTALLIAHAGPRRALEVAEPLLQRASGRALAWACMPASYALARMGRIDEALAAARRGHAEHVRLTEPTDWYPWMHHFYKGEALAHAGRFPEAEELATNGYQDGVQWRSSEAQAMFSWQLAKSVPERGHVDDAVRHAQTAISIYRQLGRPQFEVFCRIYQAQALAIGNRPDPAAATFKELERLDITPSWFMGVDLLQARGWLSVAAGKLREARDVFVQAADEGERIGDLVGAAAALHNAARIGYAKFVAVRLGQAAADVEGDVAPARVAHTSALAAADPVALEDVSTTFKTMGASLLAAEAAADAAVVWKRLGDPKRTAAAERRSGWLAGQCPGADTPALRAIGSRARLTPAEWETAQLAAFGRSNRDIADELVVSVRTIENRLQHVYGKLGVSGRAALADALATIKSPVSAR